MKRRNSPKRDAIRTVLMTRHVALSASTIHASLPHIDLTTIYRNLELFVSEGTVKKLLLQGETLYEYQTQPHHHAICDNCHQILHFTTDDAAIKKILNVTGFTITEMEITLHGLCTHKK